MQRTLLGSTDGSTDGLADKLFQGKEALMWERRQSDSQRAPDCGQTREALETSGAAVGKRNRLVMGHTPQFNGVSEGSYTFRHPPATDDDEPECRTVLVVVLVLEAPGPGRSASLSC